MEDRNEGEEKEEQENGEDENKCSIDGAGLPSTRSGLTIVSTDVFFS